MSNIFSFKIKTFRLKVVSNFKEQTKPYENQYYDTLEKKVKVINFPSHTLWPSDFFYGSRFRSCQMETGVDDIKKSSYKCNYFSAICGS